MNILWNTLEQASWGYQQRQREGPGNNPEGIKGAGDRRLEGTRQRPGVWMTQEWSGVVWGGTGAGARKRGRIVGLGLRVRYTKLPGTRMWIGQVGRYQQQVHNNKQHILRLQQSLTQFGTPPTNNPVTLYSPDSRITHKPLNRFLNNSVIFYRKLLENLTKNVINPYNHVWQ